MQAAHGLEDDLYLGVADNDAEVVHQAFAQLGELPQIKHIFDFQIVAALDDAVHADADGTESQ